MSNVKSELSKKNKYWIDKHRYYELKHFCLQYPCWKVAYNSIDGLEALKNEIGGASQYSRSNYNPTEKYASMRLYLAEKMELIEQCCLDTDPVIGNYILKAVTKGLSYDTLRMQYDIPCCRDIYYDLYRKFFWILSQRKR